MIDVKCPLCHSHQETASHLFLQCPLSVSIQKFFNIHINHTDHDIHKIIIQWVNKANHPKYKRELPLLCCIFWVVWNSRNKAIFRKEDTTTGGAIKQVQDLIKSWTIALTNKEHTTGNGNKNETSQAFLTRQPTLFGKPHPIMATSCPRHCNKRDARICLGLTNEHIPNWIMTLNVNGKRETLEGRLHKQQHQQTQTEMEDIHMDLPSFTEAIFTMMFLLENYEYHSIYIITDGIISQIWSRYFRRISRLQEWKHCVESLRRKNCNFFWYPTKTGCFHNLLDVTISHFNWVPTHYADLNCNRAINLDGMVIYDVFGNTLY